MISSRYATGAVVLIAALAAASLTSCTASSEGGGTIRVFHAYPELYDIPLAAVAEAYEEEHPGTDVVIESAPYTGYAAALQTQLQGGTAADVMLLDPPEVTSFSSRGFLMPLGEAIAGDAGDGTPWSDRFVSGAVSNLISEDGEVYALPWSMINIKLIYRADLLEAAGESVDGPATWDDSIEIQTALEKSGVLPNWFGLSGTDANLWWRLTLMLNAGFRPLTEDINLLHGDEWAYDPSSPDTVAGEVYSADEKYVAFENGLTDPAKSDVYREAVERLLEMRGSTGDATSWVSDISGPFISGELAQLTGVDSQIPGFVTGAEEAGFGAIDVRSVQLPPVTEDEWAALTAGPTNPLAAARNGFAINEATDEKDLALDFLRFATSTEGQEVLYAAGGSSADGAYATSAMVGVTYPDDSGITVDEDLQMVPELSLYGFGLPPTYDQQDFDEFNGQLQQLWTEQIGIDEFLELRSASNRGALERNLEVYADSVDRDFIASQTE